MVITPICLELFIDSLELFILYTLNRFRILVYLRHSFSYIFFNPLFSKKATAHEPWAVFLFLLISSYYIIFLKTSIY